LKYRAINSHREWVAAGKPYLGDIAETRKKDKYCYRQKKRQRQASDKNNISSSLHTALINKKQGAFLKMWRSKFGLTKSLPSIINGKNCKLKIANEFAVI